MGVAPSTKDVTHQATGICYSGNPPANYLISRRTEDICNAYGVTNWNLDQHPTLVGERPLAYKQINGLFTELDDIHSDLSDYNVTPAGGYPDLLLDFTQQLKTPTPECFSNVFPIHKPGHITHGITEDPGLIPDFRLEQYRIQSGFVKSHMSLGQTSLYRALMSLEHTFDESNTHSSPSHDSPGVSSSISDDTAGMEDADDDPDGIETAVCGELALDPSFASGPLLFVLQSYANWIRKMMFDPSRATLKLRDRVMQVFFESAQLRDRVILIANLLQAVIILSANYKTMLSMLAQEVRQTLVESMNPRFPVPWDIPDTRSSSPLHLTLELNLFYLVGPVHEGLQVLGDIAPVLHQMCSDNLSPYIHLPSLLDHPDDNVRGYPAIDILYSMLTGLPTKLKYDATSHSKPHEIGRIGPVATWLMGQPNELTLILARVGSLYEEFGIDVNPCIIEEIESDIRDFKPDPGTSANPSLIISRLVVLESWRQVGYINLYMRLCGESASGPRVRTAQKRLMELITSVKPSHKVNLHLGPCLAIAGLVATREKERRLILERLQSLPHSQVDSFPKHGIRTVRDIWMRADSEGRPAQWSDLRVATRRILGI
ncbi:hypothetical protein RSOLAG1IB_12564 [Rhizoctonia solani AG-1 IB]|uniref:Uncharacterized protein n=1 Tax=Thanatephorus cucumeris (strain AG1-IB / isolate 7/3/14) TaxID=1108050 RepID=A0A0B7FWT6_THACB|nr:hypothetical protein RSOLAG1IB_12564 [Rhizoctonia solani AG-1 IB]